MSRVGKFVKWFVTFGLSFLVANWGWTEQGKAFFFIDLGVDVALIIAAVLLLLIVGDGFFTKIGASMIAILWMAFEILLVLFATWGATKLFDVDFYVAYQIMNFGQCLCITASKKED